MKPSEILVGVTYKSRGKGTARRTVLAIGNTERPDSVWGEGPPPLAAPSYNPGVLFSQNGQKHRRYLSSFAKWAGGPVEARDDG